MKKIALALALLCVLSACGTGTTAPTNIDVVAWLKTNCSAVVADAADVATLITADPAITTIAGFGELICNAIKVQQAATTPTASAGGVVVVNGVPVHYSIAK